MGSNSSAYQEYGNPVLNTFGGFIVQPYWLIIVQLIVIQTLQRLHSKFKCWGEKTWYIALEIAVLRDIASKK